jgi:hypothetical protein
MMSRTPTSSVENSGTLPDPPRSTQARVASVATFDGHALSLTLPSGRAINYPGARLAPNRKFEDGDPNLEF